MYIIYRFLAQISKICCTYRHHQLNALCIEKKKFSMFKNIIQIFSLEKKNKIKNHDFLI